MTEECVFCGIIEGEIPSHTVYEDENVVAFLDANPVSRGHTLVVPKKHVETVLEAEDMWYMWDAIFKVANAVDETFDPEGLNITQNNGEAAGQEVFHMHFHITPRYTGDEIDIDYDREELEDGEDVASELRENIN